MLGLGQPALDRLAPEAPVPAEAEVGFRADVPQLGRFLQVDPIAGGLQTTMTMRTRIH